jgi:hypothetical protein
VGIVIRAMIRAMRERRFVFTLAAACIGAGGGCHGSSNLAGADASRADLGGGGRRAPSNFVADFSDRTLD